MTTMDPTGAFGREVRRRRIALGMTLEVLAEYSGLTQNFIGTVENSKRDPSFTTIHALAKGLGVKPGELFEGASGLSAASMEAGRLFDRLPPAVQGALLVILRVIKKTRPT